MAAKICTIEVILPNHHRFVASPNWQSPLDSPVVKERVHAFFFSSKREAKLFARSLRKCFTTDYYKPILVIDDLPF